MQFYTAAGDALRNEMTSRTKLKAVLKHRD
jgi:hypothetical protein